MASIQIVTGAVARPGVIGDLRGTATGAQVVADAHARYSEAAVRSALFHVSSGAAGVAPGTALSTAPPLALWNPPTSNKIASIIRLRVGYISGTIGAGSLVYGWCVQATAPTGGTELQPIAGLLANVSGAVRAFSGSTLAATPTSIAPAMTLAATVGTVTTTMIQPLQVSQDEVAGEIQMPPGVALVVQGIAAAGTTPLIIMGISYEELPSAIAV